jgi:hypothetical protein
MPRAPTRGWLQASLRSSTGAAQTSLSRSQSSHSAQVRWAKVSRRKALTGSWPGPKEAGGGGDQVRPAERGQEVPSELVLHPAERDVPASFVA